MIGMCECDNPVACQPDEPYRIAPADPVTSTHFNIIKQFINKLAALSVDKDLLFLERTDPAAFQRAAAYIRGMADLLSIQVTEKSPGYGKSFKPRKRQRRTCDNPGLIPEGKDRRSGLDADNWGSRSKQSIKEDRECRLCEFHTRQEKKKQKMSRPWVILAAIA
jgi:hypothetical protein